MTYPKNSPEINQDSISPAAAPVAAWWSKQEKMLSAERRQQEQLGFHRAFDQTWSSRSRWSRWSAKCPADGDLAVTKIGWFHHGKWWFHQQIWWFHRYWTQKNVIWPSIDDFTKNRTSGDISELFLHQLQKNNSWPVKPRLPLSEVWRVTQPEICCLSPNICIHRQFELYKSIKECVCVYVCIYIYYIYTYIISSRDRQHPLFSLTRRSREISGFAAPSVSCW